MLKDTPILTPNSTECNGTTNDGPAAAARWLAAQVARGETERFAKIIEITPSLAEAMLATNGRNRQFKRSRAEKYANIMREGRWPLTTEGFAFSRSGKLINGQHRLTAVIQTGCTVRFTVWFGCEEGEFAFMDQGGNRTAGDLLSVDGFTNSNIRAACAQLECRVRTASALINDSNKVSAVAHEMAGDVIDTGMHYAHSCRKVVNPTSAVFAYYTIANATAVPHRMAPFWDALVSGANLPPKSPILRLREFLRTNAVNSKNSRDRSLREAAAIVLAWNAYIKNGTGKTLAWPHTVKMPEVV